METTMDHDVDRDTRTSEERYDARRAAALVLLVALFAVLAAGLLLFSGEGETTKSGARVEAPKTPATAPN
jgi:hypothetical protein